VGVIAAWPSMIAVADHARVVRLMSADGWSASSRVSSAGAPAAAPWRGDPRAGHAADPPARPAPAFPPGSTHAQTKAGQGGLLRGIAGQAAGVSGAVGFRRAACLLPAFGKPTCGDGST